MAKLYLAVFSGIVAFSAGWVKEMESKLTLLRQEIKLP